MVPGRRLGKKTGPKPGFTRHDVARVALAVGLDQFTLAQVASELAVATSSLYRVVASRDEVIEAALQLSLRDVVWPDRTLPWDRQLRAIAEMVWELCDRHPGYAATVCSFPGAHAVVLDDIALTVRSFVAQGMSVELAELAYDFVLDTVFTTHQNIDVMRAVAGDGRSGLETARERIGRLAPAADAFEANPAWAERGYLDAKLDMILFAVAHRFGQERTDDVP